MKPTHRHHFIGGSHVATISSVWGLSHADAATKLRPPPGVHPTPTHVLAERCVAPMHPSHLARLQAHRDGSSPLPVAVDHSVHPALDQGQTSSCTAHALAKCVQILTGRLGSPHVLYSLTGAAEGESPLLDDGRMLVAALAVAASPGLAPFEGPTPDGRVSDVTDAADGDPTPNVCIPATPAEVAACVPFVSAGNSLSPTATDLAEQAMACIAAGGVLYVGTQVGAQFQSLTGQFAIAVPTPSTDLTGGGHALVVVGYVVIGVEQSAAYGLPVGTVLFRVENSWSESWDSNGECWASREWLAACGEIHPLLPSPGRQGAA